MSDSELINAIGGPIDDFIAAKVRIAVQGLVQTITDPSRLAESIDSLELVLPAESRADLANALSAKLRAMLTPLVK